MITTVASAKDLSSLPVIIPSRLSAAGLMAKSSAAGNIIVAGPRYLLSVSFPT